MAILTPDDLLYGIRGRVGEFVFRRVDGKTVMSRRPRKPDASKQTEAQKKTRSRFQLATIWAKNILAEPEKKARYTELAKQWGLSNARIAAIKDYMRNEEGRDGGRVRGSVSVSVREERKPEIEVREQRSPEIRRRACVSEVRRPEIRARGGGSEGRKPDGVVAGQEAASQMKDRCTDFKWPWLPDVYSIVRFAPAIINNRYRKRELKGYSSS